MIDKKGLRKEELEQQLNEIEIINILNFDQPHSNIVQLLDFFEDANNFHIVFEYLELTYLDYITGNQNLKER
jgi:serine/threonine protein kinase